MIRSEKNAENRKRLSRFRFQIPLCAGRMIFEKLWDWVRYFTPVRDIPDRKAFPGGAAAHPNSKV